MKSSPPVMRLLPYVSLAWIENDAVSPVDASTSESMPGATLDSDSVVWATVAPGSTKSEKGEHALASPRPQ